MDELAIKIEHVSKQYRLGAIGGGTLRGDLQTWWARKRGKEDPNSKIGARTDVKIGERFLALDDINLEVKKGEALGIIGHNGAGKSTLLKLLSRVTAPTTGTISYNGRITSMLEVGTGFHPELTGRENIYMNGAILGLSKKEIDAKMEQIIDFSEVRQFIDTPVKRYSSGMYVKLAFSVAAHLDSEIMIMDEVLAVGDMAYQKKCLTKMREAADKEGRTVLYVSHNMNTIRQLCDRCIVLDHGKIIFNGPTETAIVLYLRESATKELHNDFTIRENDPWITANIKILTLDVDGKDNLVCFGSKFRFYLSYEANKQIDTVRFRFTVLRLDRVAIATSVTPLFSVKAGEKYKRHFEIDTSQISPGDYQIQIVAFEPDGLGNQIRHDYVPHAVTISIYSENHLDNFEWNSNAWGNHVIKETRFLQD